MRECRNILMLAACCMSALLLLSCSRIKDSSKSYIKFEDIGSEGWDPADIIIFEPCPADSASVRGATYHSELMLRYSGLHKMNALPISIVIEDNEGVLSADTIIVGNNTESRFKIVERQRPGINEVFITLNHEAHLTDGYSVTVNPLAPKDISRGLLNVGLIMTPN